MIAEHNISRNINKYRVNKFLYLRILLNAICSQFSKLINIERISGVIVLFLLLNLNREKNVFLLWLVFAVLI